jgi:hypothetical protein
VELSFNFLCFIFSRAFLEGEKEGKEGRNEEKGERERKV